MKLRDYQIRVLEKVQQHSRSVVLVVPVSSGKTVMGAEIARHHKTLWVVVKKGLK